MIRNAEDLFPWDSHKTKRGMDRKTETEGEAEREKEYRES